MASEFLSLRCQRRDSLTVLRWRFRLQCPTDALSSIRQFTLGFENRLADTDEEVIIVDLTGNDLAVAPNQHGVRKEPHAIAVARVAGFVVDGDRTTQTMFFGQCFHVRICRLSPETRNSSGRA